MGLSEIGIKIDSCCLKAKDQRTKGEKKRTTSSTKETATNKSTDLELYKAAGEGSIKNFNDVIHRLCLEKHLSVSEIFRQCTPLGNTLLHLASNFGNETVVQHLIEQEQSLFNKRNWRRDTALHIAARFGHKRIAEALVRFQRDLIGESSSLENRGSIIGDYTCEEVLGRSNISRKSPISKSVFLEEVKQAQQSHVNDVIRLRQRYEVHDMISKKYPLVRLPNAKGNTPLHEAIAYRQKEVVSFLINLDQEVWFCLNNERKSPLYLAVEAEFDAEFQDGVVKVMLSPPVEEFKPWSEVAPEKFNKWRKGKSPIHAAIRARNAVILNTLLKKEPKLVQIKGEEKLSPLQCAASLGYLNEVRILLAFDPSKAIERYEDGSLPIHMASMEGHNDIIRDMLPYYPDHPVDILDNCNRNILHVAAIYGQCNVVSYVLKNSQLRKLVNERDNDGNTPLHLATKHLHPKIVSALSWCKEIYINSTNNEECTALDIVEKSMERSPSFRKHLTWTALKAAGASRSLIDYFPRGIKSRTCSSAERSMQHHEDKVNTLDTDKYKDRVNTLLLVSTLIATMTFAAGFTMPGGYNDSEPDQGMATMLRKSKLHMFILCDTISMYTSIVVAIILIWAQLGNLNLVLNALRLALPLLATSLTTMCLAFMVGVSLVVGKLKWLNVAVLIIGLVFLVTITTFLFLLFLPISPSNHRILRYMSYYPYRLLLLAICTNNEDLHDIATTPKVSTRPAILRGRSDSVGLEYPMTD